MALYTPVDPNLVGAVPNLVAVASSDTFHNNGRCILHIKNASGGSVTATIDDPNSRQPDAAQAFNPDVQLAIAGGAEKYWGPFDPNRFNDVNGIATVAYSATASVTAEVIDCA